MYCICFLFHRAKKDSVQLYTGPIVMQFFFFFFFLTGTWLPSKTGRSVVTPFPAKRKITLVRYYCFAVGTQSTSELL